MTSRERLLEILSGGGRADRTPWSPLVDGYFLSAFPPGTDVLDVFREVGADVMERHVYTWYGTFLGPQDPAKLRTAVEDGVKVLEDAGVRMTTRVEPHPKGRMVTKTYEIPGRTIRSSALYTATSPFIPFPQEHLIKDVEDLLAFEYVVKRARFSPAYDQFSAEDARVGDAGIATDSGRTSPIQELLQSQIGIEPFYTTFYLDHRPELDRLLRAMHEKNQEVYEVMAASPAQVVIDYENTSTTFISPALYRQYSLQQINDYADILHAGGKTFLTHRCGLLGDLVGPLREGREDGIADIAPPPTGNLEIWRAKELLPGKVVIGGIDPTFVTGWPEDKLRAHTRDILKRAGGRERLVLGSADAVPKDARVGHLRAISEEVRAAANGGPRVATQTTDGHKPRRAN